MGQRVSEFVRQASDEYMTPTWPVHALLDTLKLNGMFWDPCCGTCNIVGAIREYYDPAPRVMGTDINADYDMTGSTTDFTTGAPSFLMPEYGPLHFVTNPPYGQRGALAEHFITTCLQMTAMIGGTVSMLLPVDFDSAKTRSNLFGACKAFDCKIILTTRIRWTNLEQTKSSPSMNHAWFHWAHDRRGGWPNIAYAGKTETSKGRED